MRFAHMLTCVIVAGAPLTAVLPQSDRALRHIDRAGELLFAEGSTDMQQGVTSLLDAVVELTAASSTAPSVRASIQTARQQLVGGSETGSEHIGRLLRDAYKGLPGGDAYRQPVSEDMEQLIAHLKERLAAARHLAMAGKEGESARTLLGIALAIVTPMQP